MLLSCNFFFKIPTYNFEKNINLHWTSRFQAVFITLMQTCKRHFFYTTKKYVKINLPEKSMWISKKIDNKRANLFKSHTKEMLKWSNFPPNAPQKHLIATIHVIDKCCVTFWIYFTTKRNICTHFTHFNVFAHMLWRVLRCNNVFTQGFSPQ